MCRVQRRSDQLYRFAHARVRRVHGVAVQLSARVNVRGDAVLTAALPSLADAWTLRLSRAQLFLAMPRIVAAVHRAARVARGEAPDRAYVRPRCDARMRFLRARAIRRVRT